jgi:hypothetical protein
VVWDTSNDNNSIPAATCWTAAKVSILFFDVNDATIKAFRPAILLTTACAWMPWRWSAEYAKRHFRTALAELVLLTSAILINTFPNAVESWPRLARAFDVVCWTVLVSTQRPTIMRGVGT